MATKTEEGCRRFYLRWSGNANAHGISLVICQDLNRLSLIHISILKSCIWNDKESEMPYEDYVDGEVNLLRFEKKELEVSLFSLGQLNVLDRYPNPIGVFNPKDWFDRWENLSRLNTTP